MTRAERIAFEAAQREAQRLRAWLRKISARTRGKGADFASSALHSYTWPDE